MKKISKTRYFPPKRLMREFQPYAEKYPLEPIGKSVEGRSIYAVTIGQGGRRILTWSQMHGNETSTTRALLKLMNELTSQNRTALLEEITLKVIFQLNPDGSQMYTRENASQADLNRDARLQQQPETKALMDVFESFAPDLCLNLHGQRTIFAAGKQSLPAALSFLSPSADSTKAITPARLTAMQLIASIADRFSDRKHWEIGRYDDGFNANCTGDYFTAKGVPTILFEAGHYPDDYDRNKTTELVYRALLYVLEAFESHSYLGYSAEDYSSIPENEKSCCDVAVELYINVNKDSFTKSLHFVQFREVLTDKGVAFEPEYIEEQSPKHFHSKLEYTVSEEEKSNFFDDLANNVVKLVRYHQFS